MLYNFYFDFNSMHACSIMSNNFYLMSILYLMSVLNYDNVMSFTHEKSNLKLFI